MEYLECWGDFRLVILPLLPNRDTHYLAFHMIF